MIYTCILSAIKCHPNLRTNTCHTYSVSISFNTSIHPTNHLQMNRQKLCHAPLKSFKVSCLLPSDICKLHHCLTLNLENPAQKCFQIQVTEGILFSKLVSIENYIEYSKMLRFMEVEEEEQDIAKENRSKKRKTKANGGRNMNWKRKEGLTGK